MIQLRKPEEFDELTGTFLLFKHSTQCPISSEAHKEMQKFETITNLPIYIVHVIEDRALSNHIENVLGLRHESPQAILIENKKVLWHDSHRKIKKELLDDVCNANARSDF